MFGIEQKDGSVILSANDKIDRGGVLVGEWRKELVVLRKEHALEQDKKSVLDVLLK